MVWETGD